MIRLLYLIRVTFASEKYADANFFSHGERDVRPFAYAREEEENYNPTNVFARMLVWISEVPPMMEKARAFR
jgi:hypothetical protein